MVCVYKPRLTSVVVHVHQLLLLKSHMRILSIIVDLFVIADGFILMNRIHEDRLAVGLLQK